MAEELEWKTGRDRINTKLKALTPAWSIIKYRDGLDASKLPCHALKNIQLLTVLLIMRAEGRRAVEKSGKPKELEPLVTCMEFIREL